MHKLKIILTGPLYVGKTTFLKCLQHCVYRESKSDKKKEKLEFDNNPFLVPVSVGFEEFNICYNEKYLLKIIDIDSQPNYKSDRTSFFEIADIAILMFSLINPQPLDDLKELYEEAKNFGKKNLFIVILGSKKDEWKKDIREDKGKWKQHMKEAKDKWKKDIREDKGKWKQHMKEVKDKWKNDKIKERENWEERKKALIDKSEEKTKEEKEKREQRMKEAKDKWKNDMTKEKTDRKKKEKEERQKWKQKKKKNKDNREEMRKIDKKKVIDEIKETLTIAPHLIYLINCKKEKDVKIFKDFLLDEIEKIVGTVNSND